MTVYARGTSAAYTLFALHLMLVGTQLALLPKDQLLR